MAESWVGARSARLWLGALAVVCGCGDSSSSSIPAASAGDDGGAPGAATSPGASGPSSDGGSLAFDAGAQGDAQAACAQLIYVIGQDNGASPDLAQPVVLYAFDPQTAKLARVGPIACIAASAMFVKSAADCAPPHGGGCTTAMAVDDHGIAWITTPFVEGSGTPQTLFGVRTSDASCVSSGVPVDAQQHGITGASFVPTKGGGGHVYVTVQDATSPTGALTVGALDTASGKVSGIQNVSSASGQLSDPEWYATGSIGTMPEGWLMVQDWHLPGPSFNGAPAIAGIDPGCQAGMCDNGAPGGGSAPDGTPVWAMGYQAFPASLTFASRPWSAVWAPYIFATTNNAQFYNDVYYFTPGWWAHGDREVLQLNLNSGMVVSQAMPDLGANAFAAASTPQCPPVAIPPAPPPVK